MTPAERAGWLANIPVLRAREELRLVAAIKAASGQNPEALKHLVAASEAGSDEAIIEMDYLIDRAVAMAQQQRKS